MNSDVGDGDEKKKKIKYFVDTLDFSESGHKQWIDGGVSHGGVDLWSHAHSNVTIGLRTQTLASFARACVCCFETSLKR